jgi:hypothetical protein
MTPSQVAQATTPWWAALSTTFLWVAIVLIGSSLT